MITRSKAPTKERRIAEYREMRRVYANQSAEAHGRGNRAQMIACWMKAVEYARAEAAENKS